MRRGRERIREKCIIPVALACSAKARGPSSKGLLGLSKQLGADPGKLPKSAQRPQREGVALG